MFLDALKGKNRGRPPVWLMRQAGRYLPQYRALREKYPLRDLFFTPDLAAKITLMPVELLKVDAAILFSDITVVALALGLQLDFCEGPVIGGKIERRPVTEVLMPMAEAIRLVKSVLKVPLIGFCGGPYTVATYMPYPIPDLLEMLTQATIEYIHLQEKAGVDAIQIFDSWANRLSTEEFQRFCVPYLKRIIEATSVPVIVFMRGACHRLTELVALKPAAISFDAEKPLAELRPHVPMAVQGNLDPDLLYQPIKIIQQKTEELLQSMRGDPGFIVNLGHGVKPDISVDAVRCLVDTVRYAK